MTGDLLSCDLKSDRQNKHISILRTHVIVTKVDNKLFMQDAMLKDADEFWDVLLVITQLRAQKFMQSVLLFSPFLKRLYKRSKIQMTSPL